MEERRGWATGVVDAPEHRSPEPDELELEFTEDDVSKLYEGKK